MCQAFHSKAHAADMETTSNPVVAPSRPDEDEETLRARVIQVFDGDGFMTDVWHPARQVWVPRVPVRLAYVDAPEMSQESGPESQQFLESLVLGKAVDLSPRGRESVGYVPIDGYRRLSSVAFLTENLSAGTLRYFFKGQAGSGNMKETRSITRNIELEMLVNGWAWAMNIWEFPEEPEYLAAEEEARRNNRGLWAAENPEPPWLFKKRARRKVKASKEQPNLFSVSNDMCPVDDCNGELIPRNGKNGEFLGCSNFPTCRYSRDVASN